MVATDNEAPPPDFDDDETPPLPHRRKRSTHSGVGVVAKEIPPPPNPRDPRRENAGRVNDLEEELRSDNPKGRLWEACAARRVVPPTCRHATLGARHRVEEM